MTDKLANYRRATDPLPPTNRLWPLYGAGFENMGQNDAPIEKPLPAFGPDELLVRHDACGLCFSDTKVINQGEQHPRIHRGMKAEPVVLGHEVIMTVVGVGENLRRQYKPGDRFIIQADIFINGVSYAYGYEIQGGLSQYSVLDWRSLNGDAGNYLIPVQPATGYAESALTEPWACVIAAYQLEYRTGLKAGGVTWVIGNAANDPRPYTLSAGFDETSHPDQLWLTNVPPTFAARLTEKAQSLGVNVTEVDDVAAPPADFADDIILLDPDADLIELVSPRLAQFGVAALMAETPLLRKVAVDMGRIHYHRWTYVGSTGLDIARAYSDVPVRSTLKPGGRTWFVGAGGPIGRMHVQRAIQVANGPATIVCTDVSDLRLNDLSSTFAAEAQSTGIEFVCLNPTKEADAATIATFRKNGFDDIIVLAPVAPVIADAATYLAPQGVMNVFAGVARGTQVAIDLSQVYLHNARFIGHSASTIDDLKLMLHQAESGVLSPNRTVAAVGSLAAAKDGLKAVRDATYPGKVVIFPNIKDLPLTSLEELKDKLPTVYAKLNARGEWTIEAEEEFLRLML